MRTNSTKGRKSISVVSNTFRISVERKQIISILLRDVTRIKIAICWTFHNSSASFASRLSASSSSNLLDSGPALSGSELCGVWTGVGRGVDGYFGGEDAGVLDVVAAVIRSRNASNCFNDSALCSVSSGLIGGTPPNPSNTVVVSKFKLQKGLERESECFAVDLAYVGSEKKPSLVCAEWDDRTIANTVPDGDAVFGIMSRKLGADELPLMTAVLNKLFVLVAILRLNPPAISIILKKPIWPAMLCRWRRVVDMVEDCVASELWVFTSIGWGMALLLTISLEFNFELIAFGFAAVWLRGESTGDRLHSLGWSQAQSRYLNDAAGDSGLSNSDRLVLVRSSLIRIFGSTALRHRNLLKSFRRSMKCCEKFCVSFCSKKEPRGSGSDDGQTGDALSRNSSSWARSGLTDTLGPGLSTSVRSFGKLVQDSGRSLVATGEMPFATRSPAEPQSLKNGRDAESLGVFGHLAKDIEDKGNSLVADS